MATIRHHVLIDAPVAKVYQALSTAEGISTWWDKQTPTQTDRGLVLAHNPGPEHGRGAIKSDRTSPEQTG